MPPTTTTTEEKAKQQEKENTERAAAVTGAQAVADSIKKAADAAVEGARAQGGSGFPPGDFLVFGRSGGDFELRAKTGPIFSSSGSVLVNGKAQQIYEWGATYIRGKFDEGVQSGEVIVEIDSQTRRTGYLKV